MRLTIHLLWVFLLVFATLGIFAQTRAVADPGVITTRQAITPAGVPTVFDGRVYGVTFGEDASTIWVANATKLFQLDWRQNRTLEAIALDGLPGLQGIQFDTSGKRPLLSGLRPAKGGAAHVALMERGSVIAGDLGAYQAGAIAIARARFQRAAAGSSAADGEQSVGRDRSDEAGSGGEGSDGDRTFRRGGFA